MRAREIRTSDTEKRRGNRRNIFVSCLRKEKEGEHAITELERLQSTCWCVLGDSLCALVRACACVSTYSAGGFREGGQGGRQAREEAREVQGVAAFEPVLARELERSPTNPTTYDACADKGEYSVSALTPRLSSLLCNSLLLPQVRVPHFFGLSGGDKVLVTLRLRTTRALILYSAISIYVLSLSLSHLHTHTHTH